MNSVRSLFREPDSLWPNILAVGYILLAYFGGWWALFQNHPGWFLFGVLAVGHGMTIAAYLMHDCGHNSIFRRNEHNRRLGRLLNVICGSNYGTYEDMRYKHMRHHVDNCESILFDCRGWLKENPVAGRIAHVLEWAYIPAVEFLMHGMQIVAPFRYEHLRDQRGRVARVALIRFSLLAGILWLAPVAALGYVLAYILFITILRFIDNFQHDYEISYRLLDPGFVPPRKGDQAYEQAHTYSNLLSERWPWLNLLVLNFAYHNAHHEKPNVSWDQLPGLHQKLYPQGCAQQLALWPQLVSFHRHRVRRVLAGDYGEEGADVPSRLQSNDAVGVNALSFLTAF